MVKEMYYYEPFLRILISWWKKFLTNYLFPQQSCQTKMSSGAGHSDEDAALKAELEQVKKEVPTIDDVKLIAAIPALVRAEIK